MPTHIVLCWSLPEEPLFVDFVRAGGTEFRIVPLRYPAWCAAVKMFGEGHIILPSQVLDGVAVEEAISTATEISQRVDACLLKDGGPPWLASLDPQILWLHLCASRYWARFVDELRKRFAPARLSVYGPFSGGAMYDGAYPFDVRALEHYALGRASEDQGRTGLPAWAHRMACRSLGAIDALAPGLLKIARNRLSPMQHVRCVLMGLDDGDYRVQRGLYDRLKLRLGDDLAWVTAPRGSHPLSAHEKVEEMAPDPEEGVYFIPLNAHYVPDLMLWRGERMDRATWAVDLRSYQNILLAASGSMISEPESDLLVSMMRESIRGLRLSYASIHHILSQLDPEYVIVSSFMRGAAFARAWTRKNRRKYILLPHGFSYGWQVAANGDADYMGLFGPECERLHRKYHPNPRAKVFFTGGLHVTEPFRAPLAVNQWRGRTQRITLLLSYGGYGHVHAYDVSRDLVRGACEAAHRLGLSVLLRCHPRSRDQYLYRSLVEEMVGMGWQVEFSGGINSLISDIEGCVAVVTFRMSGAVVASLMMPVPLVAYRHQETAPVNRELMHGLPCCVSSSDELAETIQRLRDDDVFHGSVLDAQRRYLEAITGSTSEDSYQKTAHALAALVQPGAAAENGAWPRKASNPGV